MIGLRARTARGRTSASSAPTPAALLGEDHPFVRTLSLLHAVIRQALIVSVVLVLGIVGIFRHAAQAPVLVAAAAVVQLALASAIALLLQLMRERAWDLIVDGRHDRQLEAVAAQRQRLLDLRERERLARSLERALDAAERWHELAVASRPPSGVRCLRFAASETHEVAHLLRADGAGVRGIALTARLLAGGYDSPLYQGRPEELRHELWRIRHLLCEQPCAEPVKKKP